MDIKGKIRNGKTSYKWHGTNGIAQMVQWNKDDILSIIPRKREREKDRQKERKKEKYT